jgi:uncharacterized protein YdeI (YjbR/CyaY-like superfamily)
MIPTDGFAQLEVRSAAELQAWLMKHHGQAGSVWLVTWKKAPGAPYVSVEEVLDELIKFGWIDGLRRKRDDGRTMQLISPRKQQAWAASYKRRAERLEAEGRMHPAGRAAIAAAKAAGRWNEAAQVDALFVPTDLGEALRGCAAAERFFNAAAPSYRRNVLRWLHGAKRAETRAGRIARIVELSAKGEKVPQL